MNVGLKYNIATVKITIIVTINSNEYYYLIKKVSNTEG